jgi:hypothetical protein
MRAIWIGLLTCAGSTAVDAQILIRPAGKGPAIIEYSTGADAIRRFLAQLREEQEAHRDRTLIVLDLDRGEARVHNVRQGTPQGGVRGSIATITAVPSIGPVSDRATRALALCQAK